MTNTTIKTNAGCTININNELNGIELIFDSKPSEEIRNEMKELGFRWHGVKKLWYAKITADRMESVSKLSAAPVESKEAKTKESKKETVSKYGIKIGDILTGLWGATMTFSETYKVVSIPSPTSVEIIEIGKTRVGSDKGGGEYFMPDPEKTIGESVIKRVMPDRYYKDSTFYVKLDRNIVLRAWGGNKLYENTWD